MAIKPELKTIMRSEVMIECTDEEDVGRKYFNTYCEGDMQDDDHDDDLVIKLNDLPPGAVVTLEYPSCPECGCEQEDIVKNGKIVGHKAKCWCGKCNFEENVEWH